MKRTPLVLYSTLAIVSFSLLMLGLYSQANAATRTVNIGCGKDIDATINSDSGTTATRFVLDPCQFTASATIKPKGGDEVVCAKQPIFAQKLAGFDPEAYCTISGPSLIQVMKPQGAVRLEGLNVEGGNFDGSAGSGVAVAGGAMSDSSQMYGVVVRNTEGAGISNAHGRLSRIELTNTTTDPRALGFIGSGVKGVDEFVIEDSYVHGNQGNGIWCDVECNDTSVGTFTARNNLVEDNGRAGIRYERVGMESSHGEALIESNQVHGNGKTEVRGGVDIRDAQDAVVRNNVFGGNAGNLGVRATDSGRSTRPDLKNISVANNALGGDSIKSCGGVVSCSGNTP